MLLSPVVGSVSIVWQWLMVDGLLFRTLSGAALENLTTL